MSLDIQKQIRENAMDIRNYIDDLNSWEDNVNNKKFKINLNNNGLPKAEIKKNNLKAEEDKKFKRDLNNVENYYNAWDNLDVEEELNNVDCSNNIHEFFTSKGINKEKNSKIQIKGGRQIIDEYQKHKDLADKNFKEKNYQLSIENYNETMNLITKNMIFEDKKELYIKCLSNKSQCLINLNKFDEAIINLNKVISLDNKIIKNYYRRSICYQKLNNYKSSLNDLKKALIINPNEKDIIDQYNKNEKYIKKCKDNFIKNMIIEEPKSKMERINVNCIDLVPIKENIIINKTEEKNPQIKNSIIKEENLNQKKYEDYFYTKDEKENKSEFIKLKNIEGKVINTNKINKIIQDYSSEERKVKFINSLDHKIIFTKNKSILKINGKYSIKKNSDLYLNKEEKLKISIEKIINKECLKYKEIDNYLKFLPLWNYMKKENKNKILFISNLNHININKIFKKGIEFKDYYDIISIFFELEINEIKNNLNLILILKEIFKIKNIKLINKMLKKSEKNIIKDKINLYKSNNFIDNNDIILFN